MLVREEPGLRTVRVGDDLELVADGLAGREHGAVLRFVRRCQRRGEEIARPPTDNLSDRTLTCSPNERIVGAEVPAVAVFHAEHHLRETFEHAVDDICVVLGRPSYGRPMIGGR